MTISNHIANIPKKLGDLQGHVLLVIFYFVVMGPIAFFVRLLSDPLALERRDGFGWGPVEPRKETILGAQKQA
jgi:hypothetical protein